MFKHYKNVIADEKHHLTAQTIWAYLEARGYHRVITMTDALRYGPEFDELAEANGYEIGLWTLVWHGYPTNERWLFFERQEDAILASLLIP